MATLVNNNIIEGNLDNLIFVKRGNQTYIRTRPRKVRNPQTEEQEQHRKLFKALAQVLKEFRPLLKVSFGSYSVNNTIGFNQAMHHNLGGNARLSPTGKVVIDYGKLVLGNGPIGAPRKVESKHKGKSLRITWDASTSALIEQDDLALLAVYNATQNKALCFTEHFLRTEGSATIAIPTQWTAKDAVYIYLSFARMNYSKTGEQVVVKL